MRTLWDDKRYGQTDARIIRQKAWKMLGHYGYRVSDIEDIEQALATHLFQQMHRYQPACGPRETFVRVVVENKLRHMIAHRTAQKRNQRHNVRVDDLGGDNMLAGGETTKRRDRGIDVRDKLNQLPEPLRRIADLLKQQYTEKEIGNHLGLSRGQVRWRIQQIAQEFRAAGLAPDADR